MSTDSHSHCGHQHVIERLLDTHQTTMDQIYQALQQPDVGDDRVSREFRHVKELVQDVKVAFGKVTERLLGFDVADFKDNFNNTLRLSGQWREYPDRFQSILIHSCNNASVLSSFILQISQDLLDDAGAASITERVSRLRTVSRDLENKMESATQIKVDLERMANDMRSAASSYENEMEKAKGGLANDLQSVRARRSQLEDMSRQISEMLSRLPSGFGGIQIRRELDRTGPEMSDCDKSIARLTDKERLLSSYQNTLRKDVLDAANKIEGIAWIWKALRSDILMLKEELSFVTDSDMPVSKMTMKKIATTRGIYLKVAAALDMYSSCNVL
ncbi:hypothetical protein C8Q73DRAFT_440843 [Cubamyces lactineus]|nr:hypothetical protein C8Q73DRAFT_440843 [Cubamyces lactineus]